MDSGGITGLLKAWGSGDEGALQQLTAVVYVELRTMARRYVKKEPQGNILQTTALVNEAYLRLVDVKSVDWQHRAHFFAIAANIMRRILVDAARARSREKRGGDFILVSLDHEDILAPASIDTIVELDEALEAFSRDAPRQAKVVELRYFGGLGEEEIAEVLKVSGRTVKRDWDFARSWLMRELSPARIESGKVR